jgi:hypothetical protein
MEKEEEKGTVREGEEGALVRRSHSPAATARFFAQTGRKNVQVQRNLHKVKTISSMWFQWYRLQFRIDIHQQVFCARSSHVHYNKECKKTKTRKHLFPAKTSVFDPCTPSMRHRDHWLPTVGRTGSGPELHRPTNTAGASHRDCIRARRAL